MTAAEVARWIRDFAAAVAEHKDELTELDSAIGDGDHGINMDRGMTAVVAALDASSRTIVPALAKAVGMTLISKVGGAGGPLYGTLFLQFGLGRRGPEPLDAAGLGAAPRGRPAPACGRGARRSRATRPWWTRSCPPPRPSGRSGRRRVLRRRARRGRRTPPRRARAPRSHSSPERAVRAISASEARGTRTRGRPRVPSWCDAPRSRGATDSHQIGGLTWPHMQGRSTRGRRAPAS